MNNPKVTDTAITDTTITTTSRAKSEAAKTTGQTTQNNHTLLQRLFTLRAFILCSFMLYVVGFNVHPSAIPGVGLLVITSVIFSIISWWSTTRQRLSSKPIPSQLNWTLQLIWDSGVILVFVWIAGRSMNPFIYYQLLIIAVSANILPERFAWLFSLLGIGAYTTLIYVDLGHHMSHMDDSFKSHILGMWVNFSGSALLIAFFISRLSSALRRQEEALRLAREENLKHEQVIGIGMLAASTVHSFGTPLSTITMAASEIDSIHSDKSTRDCTAIIKAQIDRCKNTMQKLTSLTTPKNLNQPHITVKDLVAEIREYLYLINANPMPSINVSAELHPLRLSGGILLLHAVINLIDNAVNAAHSKVVISFSLMEENLHIIIEDDGDGIHSDAIQSNEQTRSKNKEGLGIGLLLVNSTIERLGGSVLIQNPTDQQALTQVIVKLPYES